MGIGLERVPGRERLPVHAQPATRHVDIGLATRRERMRGAFRALEQAGVKAHVLMHAYRAAGPVGRCDEAQAPALFTGGEVPLLVGGRDAGGAGLDPDLQEMRDAGPVLVEFAMAHAAAGAHALHVAGHDGGAVPHGVLVAERALEHVAEDLHVAVAVRAEARARPHAVFVDHAQRAVADVARIVVVGEREAVVGLEPAVPGVAALVAGPQFGHADYALGLACCAAISWCTLAMSTDLACAITCSRALPGSAPACWNRITLSRNTISVGIERMPKAPASSCCSSVLILANTTSGCASEAFS